MDQTLVFCGDWNANIGPVNDETPRNLVTNIEHKKFNRQQIQGAFFADGGFSAYLDPQSGEYVVKQASSRPINPVTGELYHEKDLAPLDISAMSPRQAEEAKRFRQVMRLDGWYETNPFIADETIYQAEKTLAAVLKDQTLKIHPAKTVNNETGITITLDKKIWEKFQSTLDESQRAKFQFEYDAERGDTLIYAARANAELLYKSLIDNRIKQLEIQLNSKTQAIKDELNLFIQNIPQKYMEDYLGRLLDSLIKHVYLKPEKTSFLNSFFSNTSSQKVRQVFHYSEQIQTILNRLTNEQTIAKEMVFPEQEQNFTVFLKYLLIQQSLVGQSMNIDRVDAKGKRL